MNDANLLTIMLSGGPDGDEDPVYWLEALGSPPVDYLGPLCRTAAEPVVMCKHHSCRDVLFQGAMTAYCEAISREIELITGPDAIR